MANLLCRLFLAGDIYLQVVPVPLYLSKLRLAEVVGIKGETPDVWSSFNQEISVLVRDSVKFDTSYGNKGIDFSFAFTITVILFI